MDNTSTAKRGIRDADRLYMTPPQDIGSQWGNVDIKRPPFWALISDRSPHLSSHLRAASRGPHWPGNYPQSGGILAAIRFRKWGHL